MEPTQGSPECARIREELAALVYGELDPARRAEVQRHVAGCAACGAEERDLRELRGRLDLWRVPLPGEDAAALAGEARRRAARQRAPLRRTLWLSVAAVLLAALFAAGGSLRLERDALTLELRVPWKVGSMGSARRAAPAEEASQREAKLRRIAGELVDERAGLLAEQQLAWLREWSRLEEARRAALAWSFDQARAEDRELVARLIERALARTASEDRLTRGALADLALVVSRLPQ